MFNEAVITTAGLALDSKIRSGEAVAEFTRMGLGDGEYDGTEELDSATALKSIRQSIGISSIKRTNETTVRLRVIADNEGIEEGYYISELGIFANDPDMGEILYSIATGVAGKMDYQPSENELAGATSTIDVFTSVSNAECAVITTGTGAAASAEELADLEVRVLGMEEPEFDDSGEVEGIESFPDFLAKVKSKMNFFQFFRDFKAGMQFVLHVGDIINNCTSDETDKPLSAAQGKALMNLYTQLNSNFSDINGRLIRGNGYTAIEAVEDGICSRLQINGNTSEAVIFRAESGGSFSKVGTLATKSDLNDIVKLSQMQSESSVQLGPNETTTKSIPVTAPLGYKIVGTVDTRSDNVHIITTNYYLTGDNKVKINVKNTSSETITFNLYANILCLKI